MRKQCLCRHPARSTTTTTKRRSRYLRAGFVCHPLGVYTKYIFCRVHQRQEKPDTYVRTHECVRVRVLGIACIERRCGDRGPEEKGIDFSAGLCEMKPGRAIAINNDKNNPIRRLFDLSAPIFRARSIRLITILLDLGGARRAESRTSRLVPPQRRASDRTRSPRARARAREIEFIESCPTNYVGRW